MPEAKRRRKEPPPGLAAQSECRGSPRIAVGQRVETISVNQSEAEPGPMVQPLRMKAGALAALQRGDTELIHEGQHMMCAHLDGAFGKSAPWRPT